MLDRDSWRRIQQIQKSIPRELLKGLVEKKMDNSSRDAVETALRSGKMGREDAKKLEKMCENGQFTHQSSNVNREVEKKIGEFVNAKVDNAKARGEVKVEKNDPWVKKMQAHHKGGTFT